MEGSVKGQVVSFLFFLRNIDNDGNRDKYWRLQLLIGKYTIILYTICMWCWMIFSKNITKIVEQVSYGYGKGYQMGES